MTSGQAAIAVAVNAVQLVSAAVSLSRGEEPDNNGGGVPSILVKPGRSPEEASAFVFLALSTLFLGVSVLAHSWLLRMPAYKTLIAPMELENKVVAEASEAETERQPLLPRNTDTLGEIGSSEESPKARIIRVAKANVVYEIAIGYAFLVTLVGLFFFFSEFLNPC